MCTLCWCKSTPTRKAKLLWQWANSCRKCHGNNISRLHLIAHYVSGVIFFTGNYILWTLTLILDLLNPKSICFDRLSRITTVPNFKWFQSGVFVLSYTHIHTSCQSDLHFRAAVLLRRRRITKHWTRQMTKSAAWELRGRNHCQYSLRLPTEGRPRSVGLGGCLNGKWFHYGPAKLRDSIRIRIRRHDSNSIRKWRADSKISNQCAVTPQTTLTHCSTKTSTFALFVVEIYVYNSTLRVAVLL